MRGDGVAETEPVVPGAGAFEIACNQFLKQNLDKADGRAKLGIEVFAESLLVVPKALAENSGHDAQEVIIKMRDAVEANPDAHVGFDINTGDVLDPMSAGILDTFLSKIIEKPMVFQFFQRFATNQSCIKNLKK